MLAGFRYYIKLWFNYLVVLILSAGFLLAYQQKQLPTLEESPVANWLKNKQVVAASQDNAYLYSSSLEHLIDSRHWFSGWLEDDKWVSGVNRYLKMAVDPKNSTWNSPPAGKPVSIKIINLQNEIQTKASIRKYHSIEAELITTAPYSINWRYILELEVQGKKAQIEFPDIHGVIELIIPSKGQISLQIIRKEKGFCFFCSEEAFTNATIIPLTNLQPDTPKTVTLRNPNSTDPSSYLVRLTIKATDLDRLSGDDFNTAKPKVVELEDNKVTTLKGEVSFNGMDSNDHLLLRRNDRYTAVIVMGDSDLQRRAWIESDHAPLERIGSYSSQIPLLVAVTNSWSSLRLNFRVYEPGDFLQYRILTMSGKNIPGRELIIEAIGKHLTDLSFHDRPISGPELHTAVEWLVKSLDVHFTDEDVHETDPLQVQTLIKDLVTVTNTGSSPTASPKVEIVP